MAEKLHFKFLPSNSRTLFREKLRHIRLINQGRQGAIINYTQVCHEFLGSVSATQTNVVTNIQVYEEMESTSFLPKHRT